LRFGLFGSHIRGIAKPSVGIIRDCQISDVQDSTVPLQAPFATDDGLAHVSGWKA
jgi:hypothetical protein